MNALIPVASPVGRSDARAPRRQAPCTAPLTALERRDVASQLEALRRMARITSRRSASLGEGELYSAGAEALIGAARSFVAARGVKFGTYATHRVRGAMLDALRVAARESGRRLEGDPLEDEGDGLAGIPAAAHEARVDDTIDACRTAGAAFEALARACATLPAFERRMLALRFRADLDRAAVAAELGVSRATLGRRLTRVLRELGERLRADGVHGPPAWVPEAWHACNDREPLQVRRGRGGCRGRGPGSGSSARHSATVVRQPFHEDGPLPSRAVLRAGPAIPARCATAGPR